jgi:hypothetical protein
MDPDPVPVPDPIPYFLSRFKEIYEKKFNILSFLMGVPVLLGYFVDNIPFFCGSYR